MKGRVGQGRAGQGRAYSGTKERLTEGWVFRFENGNKAATKGLRGLKLDRWRLYGDASRGVAKDMGFHGSACKVVLLRRGSILEGRCKLQDVGRCVSGSIQLLTAVFSTSCACALWWFCQGLPCCICLFVCSQAWPAVINDWRALTLLAHVRHKPVDEVY